MTTEINLFDFNAIKLFQLEEGAFKYRIACKWVLAVKIYDGPVDSAWNCVRVSDGRMLAISDNETVYPVGILNESRKV